MLEPTLLASLEASGTVVRVGRTLVCEVERAWCAPGETRIGYSTIIRLVECVREIHWEEDVKPICAHSIDCITRSLTANFVLPITAGMKIRGQYYITEVRRRSYEIQVTLTPAKSRNALAISRLVCVFWDGQQSCIVVPPVEVIERLRFLRATPSEPA